MTNKNIQQVKNQALYIVKEVGKRAESHKAKCQILEVWDKASTGARTQVDKHHKVRVIVGVAVIAKTAFDLIKRAKPTKSCCCKGKTKTS